MTNNIISNNGIMNGQWNNEEIWKCEMTRQW